MRLRHGSAKAQPAALKREPHRRAWDQADQAWADTLNSQLQRLANEIGRRSSAQQTLLTANLSAAAAIAGIVVSGATSPLLLLIIPIVSTSFGNQWIDHHRVIHRIGDYMATVAEPALSHATAPRGAVDNVRLWESFIRSSPDRLEALFAWRLPMWAVFLGASVLALTLCIPSALIDPTASAMAFDLPIQYVDWWARGVWLLAMLWTAYSALATKRALRSIA